MPTRKTLLRILLWSLAVAAVTGVGTVLLANFQTVWRVPATALATAVCAGLMLLASLLADRPKVREAGLLGMYLVVAGYLLALLLTWAPDRSWRFEESVGLTILFLALCGLPAVGCLCLIRLPDAKVAGYAGAVLAGACLLIFLIAAWVDLQGEWYELGGALAGIGALGAVCLTGLGTDRRHWRWVGVAAAAVAFTLAAVGIFYRLHGDPTAFVVALATASAVAHANIVVRCPLTPGQRWLRYVTVAAGIAAAALLAALTSLDFRSTWEKGYPFVTTIEFLGRLAAAAGIVAGCGTLALLVLARLNRRLDRPATPITDLRQLTLVCPLCQKKQTQPVGHGHCPTCGLIFRVQLDEPRCPTCGYSLLMLTSDRCPECGTPVLNHHHEDTKAQSDAAPARQN